MNNFLVLIPAYNEEQNVGEVLKGLLEHYPQLDILVVNDGSSDRTADIVKSYNVHLISHPTNLGYGAALQTGYMFASERNYAYVIQFDADGQHETSGIQSVMDMLEQNGVDIVIGSRFLRTTDMKVGMSKRLAIQMFKSFIYLLTGHKISDPTSGLRGFSHHVFHKFVDSRNFPSDFPDSNFLIQLLLQNYQLKEVAADMKDRAHGESMHGGIKNLVYVMQIMLSIFIILLRYKRVRRGK